MTIHGNLQAQAAPRNRRSAARRKLSLDLRGERADGEAGNVTLLNLSTSGVLLRTEVRLQVGERIRLDFPDHEPVAAKVVWASDNMFGCRFERPISQATASAASLLSPFVEAAQPSPPPADEPDAFGPRVQRMRRQRGMSLQELANQVGVSKPALWKWERGEVRPRPAALARLSAALGVDAAELMFGTASGRNSDAARPTSLRAILDATKDQVATLLGLDPAAVEVTMTVRD